MATVLQKYFDKGWLKFGNSYVTEKDRLDAGNRLYFDFYKAGIVDLRIPDLQKPHVDGGNAKGTPEFVLDARARFNKAILSLKPEQSFLIWNIVCLDKQINIPNNVFYRHNIEVFKEELCKSLDALYWHYYGKFKTVKHHSIVSMVNPEVKVDFEKWMEGMTR